VRKNFRDPPVSAADFPADRGASSKTEQILRGIDALMKAEVT
jgi:hypothetical protein